MSLLDLLHISPEHIKAGRSREDDRAEAAADAAWSNRKTIEQGTGADELTAKRLANSVSEPTQPQPHGYKTLNDIIPAADVAAFNAEATRALTATERDMPDMARVHAIGRHVIEITNVTPTPERIEVHLGTHADVA